MPQCHSKSNYIICHMFFSHWFEIPCFHVESCGPFLHWPDPTCIRNVWKMDLNDHRSGTVCVYQWSMGGYILLMELNTTMCRITQLLAIINKAFAISFELLTWWISPTVTFISIQSNYIKQSPGKFEASRSAAAFI